MYADIHVIPLVTVLSKLVNMESKGRSMHQAHAHERNIFCELVRLENHP